MRNVFELHLYFTSEKTGKSYIEIVNCGDRVELARTIMTFKPKRGYKLDRFEGCERPILF